jgi:hypothetical protein
MLDGQSLRAARVIVDIGMHLELEIPADNTLGVDGTAFHPGETWTPELGLEFMRLHCRMNDEVLQFEVKRYLGLPGQAPAFALVTGVALARREVDLPLLARLPLGAVHGVAGLRGPDHGPEEPVVERGAEPARDPVAVLAVRILRHVCAPSGRGPRYRCRTNGLYTNYW